MEDPKNDSEGKEQTRMSKMKTALLGFNRRALDIIKNEFLKATKSKSIPEGKRKVGEIAIQEGAQFILSNIGDRIEIILYSASLPTTYYLFELKEAVDFAKKGDIHDLMNLQYSIGLGLMLYAVGRVGFVALIKPIIKSYFNSKRKLIEGGKGGFGDIDE